MRKLTAAAFLVVLTAALPAAAAVPTLSFKDVKPGMKGTGRTVFEGTEVETFEVEIVAKLPNIGPDQDLILGRCSGGPLADTGVMSGMSGSPIFVDGKLIGALAYSWGFAKEPIAGITPIDEMLAITTLDENPALARRAGAPLDPGALHRLYRPASVPAFLLEDVASRLPAAAGVAPLSVPVAVAGVSPRGFAAMVPALSDAGFLPLQGSSAGSAPAPSPPLQPGSAMGLKLTRGDVDITATGTVTWIDDDRLLAFGHPMLSLGNVDLPLTGARVELLLSSLRQSSKIATPLSEVGAIRQDRAAGVFGRLGAEPRMLPVRVQLSGTDGGSRSYSFDIADDPLLSPLLLYASLNGIFQSRESGFGNVTLRLLEGSVIKMVGQDDVLLDNIWTGNDAFGISSGLPAYILYLLMNNNWEPPEIAGVNLLLEYDDAPRTGRIERVSLDRYRASPGDVVQVRVVVSPYRGARQVKTIDIQIPPETPTGRLTLHVGGAMAVSRAESTTEPVLPGGLSQFIWLINNLRRNDRVYVAAYSEDSGVYLDGARMPNLPPSVAGVLSRPRSLGNFTVVPLRGILEEVIPIDFAVEGLAKIPLEVVEE
jgi:hypothetical protein